MAVVVVKCAQGCFPCHLSGRAVVAAPLGILSAAFLVLAPPPKPQDTAWLLFPSNPEYAAAPLSLKTLPLTLLVLSLSPRPLL